MEHWAPPVGSHCKVNVDVACRASFCAVACVGRDSFSRVLFAISKLFDA